MGAGTRARKDGTGGGGGVRREPRAEAQRATVGSSDPCATVSLPCAAFAPCLAAKDVALRGEDVRQVSGDAGVTRAAVAGRRLPPSTWWQPQRRKETAEHRLLCRDLVQCRPILIYPSGASKE